MGASLTQSLGAFVADWPLERIPPRVIERAKSSLLHNLGCALLESGSETWPRRLIEEHYAQPAEASLLGAGGGRASMDGAVVANAAALHAGAQDDIHVQSTSHPGVVIIPPALAVAEVRRASGRELLRGLVLAYEVHGRIGRRHNELVTARGYRSSCMCGVFGAAAAASALYRLDAARCAHALGLACNLAGGLGQTFRDGTTEWLWQLSSTSRSGLFAARSAASGVAAAPHSLEGERGFLRAYADSQEFADDVLAGLGESWVFDEIELKDYPVCGVLQRPAELMLRAVIDNDLAPADLAAVELALCRYEATYPGTDNPGPYATITATTMSAQFCLSLGAVSRRLAMSELARFDDPRVLGLAGRVRVVRDDALASHACRLTVQLRSGRKLVLASDGSPPVPTVELVGTRLVEAALPADRSRMQLLVAAVVAAADDDSVAGLFRPFQT
jgi:2-methylcitrate dehydratase PrpD